MNVEAVGECQRSTLFDVGLNVVAVHVGNLLVGQQNHDHVGRFHSGSHFHDVEASFFNLGPACAVFAQTHNHFHAAVI